MYNRHYVISLRIEDSYQVKEEKKENMIPGDDEERYRRLGPPDRRASNSWYSWTSFGVFLLLLAAACLIVGVWLTYDKANRANNQANRIYEEVEELEDCPCINYTSTLAAIQASIDALQVSLNTVNSTTITTETDVENMQTNVTRIVDVVEQPATGELFHACLFNTSVSLTGTYLFAVPAASGNHRKNIPFNVILYNEPGGTLSSAGRFTPAVNGKVIVTMGITMESVNGLDGLQIPLAYGSTAIAFDIYQRLANGTDVTISKVSPQPLGSKIGTSVAYNYNNGMIAMHTTATLPLKTTESVGVSLITYALSTGFSIGIPNDCSANYMEIRFYPDND